MRRRGRRPGRGARYVVRTTGGPAAVLAVDETGFLKGRMSVGDARMYWPLPGGRALPGDVRFSSKTDLARLMLGLALDPGLPASWATADEAYGKEGKSASLWSSAASATSSLSRRARPSPATPGSPAPTC
jgi:SRSO17 transposase